MTETYDRMAVDTGAAFRVGRVFGQTFQVLGGNLVPFGLIALVFSVIEAVLSWAVLDVPMFGVEALGGRSDTELAAGLGTGGTVFANVVFPLLLYALLTAILIYGTVNHLRGHAVSLGACISNGLHHAGPVILVSLAVTALVSLGTLLFIIPGLYLSVLWWVVVPVAVVESLGVRGCMKRSAELTSGNRWRILGIVFILALISIVVMVPLHFLGSVMAFVPLLILALIVNSFTLMLSSVAAGVGYYQLRVAKEGADIEQIAAVFD